MKPSVKPDPQLGATVLRLRKERGITQEALAFKADLTIATLSRIERCVTNPAWTTAQAISAALGITLRDLAGAVEGVSARPSPVDGGGE